MAKWQNGKKRESRLFLVGAAARYLRFLGKNLKYRAF
jgi:hypothetical protein